VVLIDAVPLPISAYTEYLARGVDATVLIVSFSRTTKQELERAAQLLERLEVNGVAVILNKMSLGRADRVLKGEFRTYEQSLTRRRSSAEKASARRSETSA
jgi:CO dehydrogenase nickel-insertion accessory protein CooC1